MHYISCMLCSEHAETIVITLAVLHWQEFLEIFPLAVRTRMHFLTLTSLIPNMVQQELRLVYMLMIHVSATARNERGPYHQGRLDLELTSARPTC